MFNTFPAAMSITVAGGTAEENQQLCSAVRASLQQSGFTSVQVEAGSDYHSQGMTDRNLLSCMRAINPDLFETPILIQGESEGDMNAMLAGMGIVGMTAGPAASMMFC